MHKLLKKQHEQIIGHQRVVKKRLLLLDFGEDNVDISEGDGFSVDDIAVLAQFGPVFTMHLLACGTCVTMNGKTAEGLLQCSHFHGSGRSNAPFTVPIGLRREPLGCPVPGLFTRWSHGSCAVGVLGHLNFEVLCVISERDRPGISQASRSCPIFFCSHKCLITRQQRI